MLVALSALFALACGGAQESSSTTASRPPARTPEPAPAPEAPTAVAPADPPPAPGPVLASLHRRGEQACLQSPSGAERCNPVYDAPTEHALVHRAAILGLTDVTELAVGNGKACARNSAGVAACWSMVTSGELRAEPLDLTDVTRVAFNNDHACAVARDASLWCWGDNEFGSTGAVGGPDFVTEPTRVLRVGPVEHVVLGTISSYAVESSGRAVDIASSGREAPVVEWMRGATSLAAGNTFECGVIEGEVRCPGGRTGSVQLSSAALALPEPAVEVAAGSSHACARTASGEVYCWGENQWGQLGDGSLEDRDAPVHVASVSGAEQLALGYEHSCALLRGGTLRCWGSNRFGQLGLEGDEARLTAAEVTGLGAVVEVAANAYDTCVREQQGRVTCVGLAREPASPRPPARPRRGRRASTR